MDSSNTRSHMQAPVEARTSGRRACHTLASIPCAEWVMSLDVPTASGPESPRPCDDSYDPDHEALCLDDFSSCSTLLTTSHSSASFLSGAAFGHLSSSTAFGKRTAASASWASLPAADASGGGRAGASHSHLPRLSSLENALDALTAVVTRQKAGCGSSGSHAARARRSLDVLLDEAGSPGTVAAWWACPVTDITPEEDVVFQDLD